MAEELDVEPIETENTDKPVCPYCGEIDEEWWDCLGPKDDGDDWEAGCPNCGKDFKTTIFINYTFNTEKVDKPSAH